MMLRSDKATARPVPGQATLIRGNPMKRLVLAVGLCLCVSACADPYDPGQRAAGGGLLGAGAGAAIGGLAGGGRGALAGALIGGAAGAVGGAATTPQSEPPPR